MSYAYALPVESTSESTPLEIQHTPYVPLIGSPFHKTHRSPMPQPTAIHSAREGQHIVVFVGACRATSSKSPIVLFSDPGVDPVEVPMPATVPLTLHARFAGRMEPFICFEDHFLDDAE